MSVPEDVECDEILWPRACEGDTGAFATVFERHADAVHTHCARRTGSWTDAQDLTSLVFLEAWRQRRRVHFVDGSARPWLLAVATNLARNDTRARRRYARALARIPTDRHAADVADEAIHDIATEELAVAVAGCMTQLRAEDQEVLSLCDMGELSYGEAAAVLGIPIGTVRSRLSRARTKLRALLAAPSASIADHIPGGPR